MNLRTKILIVVAVILLVAVGLSTTVALNLQGKRIVNSKLVDVEVLSNIILRSIEHSMVKGSTEDVQRSLENIGRSREIGVLRIVSNDGYILKSKDPEEIGRKSSSYSQARFKEAGLPSEIRDNSVIHHIPVPNKEICHGCHDSSRKFNGIIEMKYDISRSMADIVAIKRFLIFSNILTVLMIVGVLGIMLTKLITSPLGGFLDTIKEVEKGNWNARVKVDDHVGELGTIGKAFNKMVEEVKSLYDKSLRKEKEIARAKLELGHKGMLEELNTQLQFKIKEVETANRAVLNLSKEVKSKNTELERLVEREKRINEVGRVLTSIIDPDELVKIVIKTTAEFLNIESGYICLRKNGNKDPLTLRYQHGLGVEEESRADFQKFPLAKELLEEGRPVLVNSNGAGGQAKAHGQDSFIGVPLRMKGQIIGGILLQNKVNGSQFIPDEVDILDTVANQAMVAIENAWLYETVKNNYFGTIQSLVNALEANDRYTKGHSERVRIMGVELAKFVGLDYKDLEALEHAAILHDIGKIGIDSGVLNKEGKLTSAEFSLVRAHPIIGDEIMGPIGTLEGVRTTILQHHERYDGTGYPYGIAGDEISLKARILAVVDTFDAMVSDRPYRKALPFRKAIDELKRNAGTQFDPVVVNAFFEMIDTKRGIFDEAGYNFI